MSAVRGCRTTAHSAANTASDWVLWCSSSQPLHGDLGQIFCVVVSVVVAFLPPPPFWASVRMPYFAVDLSPQLWGVWTRGCAGTRCWCSQYCSGLPALSGRTPCLSCTALSWSSRMILWCVCASDSLAVRESLFSMVCVCQSLVSNFVSARVHGVLSESVPTNCGAERWCAESRRHAFRRCRVVCSPSSCAQHRYILSVFFEFTIIRPEQRN